MRSAKATRRPAREATGSTGGSPTTSRAGRDWTTTTSSPGTTGSRRGRPTTSRAGKAWTTTTSSPGTTGSMGGSPTTSRACTEASTRRTKTAPTTTAGRATSSPTNSRPRRAGSSNRSFPGRYLQTGNLQQIGIIEKQGNRSREAPTSLLGDRCHKHSTAQHLLPLRSRSQNCLILTSAFLLKTSRCFSPPRSPEKDNNKAM